MVHTDRFIAPNITRVDYRFGERAGFAICSQCTPVGPRETLVFTSISYRLPVDGPRRLFPRALLPLMAWYTRQVIQQDVEIMDIQTEGLTASVASPRFHNTEADVLHIQIERIRQWLRSGGDDADKPEDHQTETEFFI